VSPTVAVLVDAMSESTQNRHRGEEETNLTFAAAICASRPLAIDLVVKIDPPPFGAYQTEPGSCNHKLLAESRTRRHVNPRYLIQYRSGKPLRIGRTGTRHIC